MDTAEKQYLITLLNTGVRELRLSLPNQIIEKLIDYIALLSKWNQVYNLTAIKKPSAMLTRHILDSLSIASYLTGNIIIDVGSGAGLPAVPLALCFPEKQFVLLDSNNKKTRFLTQIIAELAINNASVVQSRVELFQNPTGFDCILTRAFAPLSAMIDSTKYLCAPGGHVFAMCGIHPRPEELGHIKDWNIKVYPLQVPNLHEQRHLVLLERN